MYIAHKQYKSTNSQNEYVPIMNFVIKEQFVKVCKLQYLHSRC